MQTSIGATEKAATESVNHMKNRGLKFYRFNLLKIHTAIKSIVAHTTLYIPRNISLSLEI